MPCARIPACPLFPHFSMKSSLRVWQSFYCEGDFTKCERFKASCAGANVPVNLLPNGKLLDVPLEQFSSRPFDP